MRACKPSEKSRKQLIRARILKNMSQAEAADAAHVNKGYYSLIERGLADPTNDLLKHICSVLEIEDWKSLID